MKYLRTVAEKLSSTVREYDQVGRFGGDEFLVVLPNCTSETAREVAERVRQRVAAEDLVIGSTQLSITVSIGVSEWHSGQGIYNLLQQADVALYRAKQKGRNCVEAESPGNTDSTPGEKRLEISHRKRQELRHSLALAVRIWGMDATGQMFEQYATTVDVTTTGAHITGVKHLLQRGCVIGIEHCSSRARYRVTWAGSAEDDRPGDIGVQLVEHGKFIWGRVIPRVFGDSEVLEFPNDASSRLENDSSSMLRRKF